MTALAVVGAIGLVLLVHAGLEALGGRRKPPDVCPGTGEFSPWFNPRARPYQPMRCSICGQLIATGYDSKLTLHAYQRPARRAA